MNRQVSEKMMPRRHGWQLAFLVAVVLCAGLWLATSKGVHAQGGYNYTVQQGDSWASVSSRTGVSVEALKEANPDAVRENDWLLVGETLLIPSSLGASPQTHRVEAGESWNSIADLYGISAGLLRAANPGSVRTGNVLFRGEILVIPPAGASVRPPDPTSAAPADATDEVEATPTEAVEEETVEPTAAATEEAAVEEETPTATPTPEEEMSVLETVTPTVTTSEVMTDTEAEEMTSEVTETVTMTESAPMAETEPVTTTEVMTSSEEITSTSTMTDDMAMGSEFDLPACPERFADYPEVMTELINSAEPGTEAVVAFLTACEALVDDGVAMADLNGDGADDLVVVYQNPSAEQIFVEGDLVIFNSSDDLYALGYRARAAGEVRLLTVSDINLDEFPDVAWVDTTCGASTCFDTVNIRSWDGTTWADWTDGTITMAYAEINLTDQSEIGSGDEIALEGGIYGSVGAGPQRSRTEVWASVDGGPYSLVEKSYSQTECLYHTVLDANRAFLDAPANGFEAAIALYTQAVEDQGLIKCWVRNDELDELRSFSQFRLALISGYSGDSEAAAAQIGELTAQYPGSIYDEVGQLWLESYTDSEDAAAACEEVTLYAEEDSAAWEMLADYGYTNPSFEAVDVCPILDLSGAAAEEGAEGETE